MNMLLHPPMEQPLSPEDRIRFARHLQLPEVGAEGQARLKDSGVLVIGAGGLGSAALVYLAAAGVGRIGIVDPERVEPGNLHRQVIHGEASVGALKVESARRRLREIHPQTIVDIHAASFSEANAENLARNYALLLDATDNLAARASINRTCIRLGVPMVYGSAQRFEGQVSVIDARRGPCYRCIFPEPADPGAMEPSAASGVFGPLPGIIGTLQTLETLKVLLSIGEPLYGRLLVFDGLAGKFEEIRIRKNPNCPECSKKHPP